MEYNLIRMKKAGRELPAVGFPTQIAFQLLVSKTAVSDIGKSIIRLLFEGTVIHFLLFYRHHY